MAYRKIKVHNKTEAELRQLWIDEYCDPSQPIYTLDNILVRFYPNMFDHAFYESDNWKSKDKSIFSLNRCEKMLWIKDALQDPDAVLKKGWDRNTKSYTDDRRAAIVKDNYIVVILIFKPQMARFVTAYEFTSEESLIKALGAPDWG